MRGLTQYWRDEIARHPVIIAWMLIFVVHAGMNANLGYQIGGGASGGIAALFYGLCFIGFACFGAWAADQIAHSTDRSRRRGMIALAVLGMIIGQWAAWQSFGLTLSRGAGQIEGQAETRASTMTALKNARAELAQIGIVRPVATIRADEVLECEKKSAQFKDGVGPKCTKLRGEMATAERARKLEADIAALTAQLAAGPNVTNANAIYEIPQALMQGVANVVASAMGDGRTISVGPDHVSFVWRMTLAFALEFFGTFGLALIRSTGGGDASGGDRHAARQGTGPTPGRLDRTIHRAERAVSDMIDRLPQPAPMLALPGGGQGFWISQQEGRSSAPDAQWASEGAKQYGSPINITFAAPAAVPPPGNGAANSAAGEREALAATFLPPGDSPAGSWPPGVTFGQQPRRDLAALPADAPPVDRSRIARELSPEEREAADVILAFRAACIVDTPGGIVVAADVWKRYRHWAGERALGEQAFVALLADVTGLAASDIGGHAHFRGIALRVGAKLEVAA